MSGRVFYPFIYEKPPTGWLMDDKGLCFCHRLCPRCGKRIYSQEEACRSLELCNVSYLQEPWTRCKHYKERELPFNQLCASCQDIEDSFPLMYICNHPEMFRKDLPLYKIEDKYNRHTYINYGIRLTNPGGGRNERNYLAVFP